MIVEYRKEYLRELYLSGKCSDKNHRFQPQVIKRFQKRVDTLISSTQKEDLFPLRSLNFEALHGDKEGLFSVRVDDKYRLEFSIDETQAQPILTVCTLEELSNHYK